MVWDFEFACRTLILEHLPEGADSVGTALTFAHVAAGLMGTEATVGVEIVDVSGREVTCLVTVSDELEMLGHGTHTRTIVDGARTQERLLAKQAKLDALAN
jgi:fluoroacetyl-CoA thioesterase